MAAQRPWAAALSNAARCSKRAFTSQPFRPDPRSWESKIEQLLSAAARGLVEDTCRFGPNPRKQADVTCKLAAHFDVEEATHYDTETPGLQGP